MNKKERKIRKQKIFGIVKKESYRTQDSVEFHSDGYKHFMVKAAIGYVLRDNSHRFLTEAEFPNGRMADVVDLHTGLVYEVETNASRKDVEEKLGNFWDYEPIDDVLVIDPTEFPDDLDEIREQVRGELVL